ncbi:MAG TPA: tetratricopeptide repeat protein [Actinomycetota bacterium]
MIGTRLRRLRTERGLTQRQLASPRYTHAYVSTIEAGRRRPSREAVSYFAEKLGVAPLELETGQPPDLEVALELRLQEATLAVSSGDLDRAWNTLRAVEREAKKYGISKLEAGAEEGMGLYLERQGKPEKALARFRRAEELLERDSPALAVDAVAGKARCFEAMGDVRYAIHVLESMRATLERERMTDPNALARVHASLVYAYLEAGLSSKAAESGAELERLAPRISDPARIAQMHMNVARLYLQGGRIDEAERSLIRAEDAYRQLNLKAEMGGAYLARGYVLSRDGQLPQARDLLEQARTVFEETGDTKDLVRTINELARVERLEGRTDEARHLLERSISLLGDGDAPILAWAHRELGLVLAETEPAVAEKHLRTAIELYERAEQAADIAVTYRALGDLLGERGDGQAACDAYRTGILALELRL